MKTKLLLIITAIGFCFPKINFGQVAPNLGAVSQFVIFSSNGAVTHTGAGINSHITGDVGSEIGGNSGFGNVDGVMRAGGLVTAAALADLNLVYLDLLTQGPLTAHVPLLGSETLPPGLYEIPVPATPSLNGVLTLDGGGDPNAYFFFKMGTDFSTGPGSEVKLINGTKACNVFWLVDGVVSVAAGTKMKGNIIANNSAINIASGVLLEGRALSTAGAISVGTGLIALRPIGCGSPLLTGALQPNLGSTSCYAIFSSDGPVTDDFASFVMGDVGTNLGSTNGYNPLSVTGAIHPIPDISTNNAATDVGPAYNYLNLLSNDIELLYPADLGFGLVLTPHTYIMNSATHLTDTLFLNAQGNPNAVFVIKINAAFTTATYAVVALRNGAQAKNVFWKIDGSVDINDYSVFKGTIVSAGAITLKTGVKIEGRVLTSVGAINTFATQVNIPVGTCGPPCIAANIVLEPTNKTICAGDSTGFVVKATATNLTYQWRKGTVNLMNGPGVSGVNNDTLIFDPASTLHNALDYNVVVIGACGNDTSINVSLNVRPNAIITIEPINKTVCVGDSTGLVVKATGSNLTYQWRKGTVNLINGAGISGVNNDTLVIDPAIALNSANNYNVIVTDDCGADTSMNVSVVVNAKTLITLEPINKTVCAGDSTGFVVKAIGTNLMYQWRKGTVNLMNGPGVSGVNNDTLIFDPASTLHNALDYNVVVTGTCGNDTSINVSLNVSPNAIITLEPINKTVCAGDSTGLVVKATGSNLTYQWRKGTVNLMNGPGISGVNNDTLIIDPANALNSANNYNVIVTGDCGADTSMNVSVVVNAKTLITLEPINKTVCAGDSTGFTVTAVGNGLTYQWRKGTVNVLNGSGISGATTATLSFNPTSTLQTANNYNVVVTGTCGSDTSINVSLTVDSSVVIIVQPVNKTVCNGDSIYFSVVASGANLTYQWRKGTVDLVNGGNISGATSDTLKINPAVFGDASTDYNVVVSGGCFPVSSTLVNLNSAGDFGILASAGISSTGFSVISNMDVGISPGLRSQITGFPPATVVNGSIFASDDIAPPGVAAMLTQAKLDLTNAYLFAEGATAPAPVTVAGDQGGTTLAPGIYKSTSTLLIQAGDLTLDAQGDANTSWIFQVASDFTTIGGAGGNVILAGGAQAKNITWQVGSSATIGNGTSFKGTILALTSITMNTGSSIEGRLLARNGSVVLSGTNLINQPINTTSPGNSNLTSVNVSLTVLPGTVITLEPINATVCAGDSTGFTVSATGTNLTYQWRKGNVNLVNGAGISGVNNDTLIFDPATTLNNATNYNVVVTGACGSDTSNNVSLTVQPGTVITLEPINATVCAGDLTSFTVAASGTNLTYQWRKGTVNLTNGSGISGATTATLSINPASVSDAATDYNVVVTGACGNDTSIMVSLTVNAKPVASITSNSPICVGETINLTATTVVGGSYQWTGVASFVSTLQNPTILNATTVNGGVYTLTVTANGCVSIPVSTTVDVNICDADLSVVKTVNNLVPFVGTTVEFTIVVTNNGPLDATSVGVNDLNAYRELYHQN